MNVLSAMTSLSLSRPTAGATNRELAAWFEAKAQLHEYLAAQGGADAAHERALAAHAHQRSLNLLTYAA